MKIRFSHVLLIGIIFISSYLRWINLETNPAWYSDEGTHIEIACHLMQGKIRYMAIQDSFLIVARLPLFEYLLAIVFKFMGVSMFSLRLLTTTCGILTLVILYRLIKCVSKDELFALVSSAIYAIYPQAVIYSRFGFSYNLLPPLLLMALFYLWKYGQIQNRKYLFLASCLLGLMLLSDFIALAFLAGFSAGFLIIRPRKMDWLILLLILLPFSLYGAIEWINHAEIFQFDLSYTLARLGGKSITEQFEILHTNTRILLEQSWWIPISLIGLLWIQPRRFRIFIILLVGIAYLAIARSNALYSLSAYYMIPFFPFVAIGISALLCYGTRFMIRMIPMPERWSRILYMIFVCLPIGVIGTETLGLVHTGFVTEIDHFLIPASEAYSIQQVLIDYAKSVDIIIISPTLAWLSEAQIMDFQMAILSQNIDAILLPKELYPTRMAFDTDYHRASFAVVDILWRDWGAIHMPPVGEMLQDIENWELIAETQSIQIYRNPKS